MNNIDKLAIDELEEIAKTHPRAALQTAYGEGVLAGINQAKALQSSEPVAWRIKHEDDDEWDISCDKPITVGNYEVQPLFTIPPSTVTLEEHNKRIAELEADIDTYVPIANQQATEIMQLQATNKTLLDALKAIEFATKPEPDDGSFHENAYTLAQQAIAEAEGKEG